MEKYAEFFPLNLIAIFPGILILGIIFYFIYQFAMNPTPFKTMKAIYVYLAALIGLLLIAAGLYTILNHLITILFTEEVFNAVFLINPLTQIIIGLFVMLPHWGIGHHFHMQEYSGKTTAAKRKK